MKMKPILLLLLCLAVSTFALAATPEGDIYSIDVKAGTIVLSTHGGLQTYRLRPDTEITLNGVRSKVSDLNTAMTAKITSGEPGIATKIIATGVPGAAPAAGDAAAQPGVQVGADAFKARLRGSKWQFSDGKNFTLLPDGTTKCSWHGRTGSWQVAASGAFELTIWATPTPPDKATLNPDVTIMTWTGRDGKGQRLVAKRVQQ